MFSRVTTSLVTMTFLILILPSQSWGITLAQRLAQDPLPSGRGAREAWLHRQVRGGGVIELPAVEFYLTRALDIQSGTQLFGRRGTVFRMEALGAFDNIREKNVDGDFATGIRILNKKDVRISDIVIRLTRVNGQIADGRWVRAISVRKSHNVKILRNDIAEFSLANGVINVDSSTSVQVNGNFIHDCYSNYTGDPVPGNKFQITGINVDDYRIEDNGEDIGSENVEIRFNKIYNLRTGPGFRSTHGGDQSDGINVSSHKAHNIRISYNTIYNTGEGIDMFGQKSQIFCNNIRNNTLFGVKVIHGGSKNMIHDNLIDGSGMANILLGGTHTCLEVTENQIHHNELVRARRGVLAVPNGGDRCPGILGRPIGNTIESNVVRNSPNLISFSEYSGYDNFELNNEIDDRATNIRNCPLW